jgi:hypothetical protein
MNLAPMKFVSEKKKSTLEMSRGAPITDLVTDSTMYSAHSGLSRRRANSPADSVSNDAVR